MGGSVEPEGLAGALLDLQRLTERLRRDCPWDREQTARTIVPHTVEEAYEVADAALAGDDEKLLDELGDLLFQVYFLALTLSGEGAGRPRGGRPQPAREARPPPPARLRRRAGATRPTPSAPRWDAGQARAGGARGDLPRRRRGAAGAPLRAQGAAAGEGGRLRVPGRPRRARRPRRRSCASSRPTSTCPTAAPTSSATSSSPPSTSRGSSTSTPSSSCAAPPTASGSAWKLRRRSRPAPGENWTELPLDRQDRYFDLAKEQTR